MTQLYLFSKNVSGIADRMLKAELFRSKLSVKKSPIHGYGVFAEQDIQKDTIIEECYALLFSSEEFNYRLKDYYFHSPKGSVLPFGYGAIYNHAKNPNADFSLSPEASLITYRANRLIKKGEEIFISYGSQWFSDRKIRAKSLLRSKLIRFTGMFFRFGLVVSAIYLLILLFNGFHI